MSPQERKAFLSPHADEVVSIEMLVGVSQLEIQRKPGPSCKAPTSGSHWVGSAVGCLATMTGNHVSVAGTWRWRIVIPGDGVVAALPRRSPSAGQF